MSRKQLYDTHSHCYLIQADLNAVEYHTGLISIFFKDNLLRCIGSLPYFYIFCFQIDTFRDFLIAS